MDQPSRISRLHALELERIGQPELLDSIARLASERLGSPFAAISVVDEDREWFLGKAGFDLDRFPTHRSLCAACMEAKAPLLVHDVDTDPRFGPASRADDLLSRRSYLGIPLFHKAHGEAPERAQHAIPIGALWCASPEPFQLSKPDIAKLSSLADLANQCIAAHAKTLELARANASLTQLNLLFKQAEEAARIGSWRLDLDSAQLSWSDEVFAVHGLPANTPVDVDRAIEFYETADQPLVRATIERAIRLGEPFSFEATIARADGDRRRIRSMGERIDTDGKPSSLAGIFMDCTEEHLRTVALERAATRDSLTGLYNRSEFDRRLVEALATQRKSPSPKTLTVMLLDLDGFKDVNDNLGHLFGDRLLARIARALDARLGGGSFLARWGGDEFAILFAPGTPAKDVRKCAQMLIAAITEQIAIGDARIEVGATCGFSEMCRDADAEELMRRADLALYHGKTCGRGEVHSWTQNIEQVQLARKAAVTQLSDALGNDRAFAAYQPIVALDTGKTVGVEALLRLRDPSGRIISAGEFFHALLDPALARRVTRFIFDQILKEASELLSLFGPDLRIGINITQSDLSRGNFIEVIDDLLKRSGLAPTNFVIEVTETMLLLDEQGAICKLLNLLDERGFTIALDDFGTGFSSLTHLRDFPIGKVKIDKDFVASMAHDHQSRMIVQALVQMGRSMGIRMVAEGVETEEQLQFLRSIGCSHAQGYLFARPASLEDWRAALKSRDPGEERDQRDAA